MRACVRGRVSARGVRAACGGVLCATDGLLHSGVVVVAKCCIATVCVCSSSRSAMHAQVKVWDEHLCLCVQVCLRACLSV